MCVTEIKAMMKPKFSMRWLWLLGAMVSAAGPVIPGCAEERAPVIRVQPDYVRKSELIPSQFTAITRAGSTWRDRTRAPTLSQNVVLNEAQWYHQITVLDKPATTGAAGVTSYTQVEKIYWEVSENMLIARQAYDRLQDGQNGNSLGQGSRQQEIVAAYAISSHFDIRNDYNSTTGEPVNVVVENTADRPWYQREYMRIDWSRNLVGTFTPLTAVAWGRMTAEAREYVSSPDDPNRPVFDYGPHNGQANTLKYFDVTNRMILHPETVNLGSQGTVPACLLFDRITESCEPADVLLRVSFRRVDPSRDYSPTIMDGHRMERFGFFEDTRVGFDPHVGTPGQAQRRHLANRHNIWMQHHISSRGLDHKSGDPACQADTDCIGVSSTAKCDTQTRTCGEVYVRCAPRTRGLSSEEAIAQANSQCEQVAGAGAGARCDLDIASLRGDRFGLCLLPYRQRTVRPIAYHLSPNYPEHLMPVTNTIMSEWRRVFNHTVREARYRECLLDPRGGGPSACVREKEPTAHNGDARSVWTACHNPVWGTDLSKPGAHTQAEVETARDAGWDNEACGPQGTRARLGDTRYSMLASVNEYDAQGPWGLAMITGDPTTGEVLSGRGSVWLTVTEAQSSYATDIMRILNREATAERFAIGQTVLDAYDYVRTLEAREETTARRGLALTPRPVMREYQSAAEVETALQQTTLDHLRTVPEDQAPVLNSGAEIHRLSTDRTTGEATEETLLRNLASQYADTLPYTNPEDASQRLGRLRGSRIESMVTDREMLLGQEIDPDLQTQAAMDRASPFRNNNMAFRNAQDAWRSAMQEHECRAEAQFSDEVIATLLYRFRRNEVPADVRFGREWNFHAAGAPAQCPAEISANEQGVSNCPLNWEVVKEYLTQYIHYGVTLHELGHSVGERHNFMGSADAWNYDDRYWPLRRTAGVAPGAAAPPATAIRPRWSHQAEGRPFYSQTELEQGVEEYGYSTVMDYVGWNQDAHGLGRYDRAFVMHGYVDMVEAFDEVALPEEMRTMNESWSGGYQSSLRMDFVNTAEGVRPVTYHYTDIPRVVGVDERGNPRLGDSNRYPVFLHETQRQTYGAGAQTPDHTNITLSSRDGTRDTKIANAHSLVPYSFGTDDWRNGVWNTQLYDAGADMYESMHYVGQRYLDYYFSNAFSRNRSTFTRNGYRSRVTSRSLDQMYYSMRNFAYIYTLYKNFYQNVAGFADIASPTSTSPYARTIQSGSLGVAMVTDTLVNALLMPQASALYEGTGRHCAQTALDGTRLWGRVNGTSCIDLPIGVGRDFATRYDFSSGFFWRDRLVSVGSYHDKQLALEYMTNTFQWIPSRSAIEQTDVHSLQINFYTLYPGATLRFFGSLLSRDHDDIGVQARPNLDTNEPDIWRTQYARLNLPFGSAAGTNGRDHGPDARAIVPNLGFTLEVDALAYLKGQLELTFDRTARVSALLWREGDQWGLVDNDSRDLVTFVNPYTNVTYAAVHIGGRSGEAGASTGLSRRDEALNETGIAARVIGYANRLRAIRDRTAPTARMGIDNELHSYIDMMDAMRDVSEMYH
jgi:hypothetical protein